MSQPNLKPLEYVFSIKNSGEIHKTITILGIRISFIVFSKLIKQYKCKNEIIESSNAEKEDYYNFIQHKVSRQSILYIEPNIDAHGEVMPFFIKYFLDLGYQVDVIMSSRMQELNPFCRMQNEHFNKFIINEYTKHIFKEEILKKYKYILFNSTTLYGFDSSDPNKNIFGHIPNLLDYRNNLFMIEHHIETANKKLLSEGRYIVLAKIPNLNDKFVIANPHYFGNINVTKKNKTTNFIMVGAIEQYRRNTKLLINSVKKLSKHTENFKITVVGRGSIKNIPFSLRKYFEIKGQLPFPNMYEEMEKSDFFLPLLDPKNPKHERYITQGTSGSFQLIYGFLKPCLIQRKFADVYNFDNKNSLVYEQNSDLYKVMLEAVNMDSEKYCEMQNSLKYMVEKIEKDSKNNLDAIFDRGLVNV